MDSPKENEDKIDKVLTGWADKAKTVSFGDMTLAQFSAIVKPSLDARASIATLEDQMKDLINQRDNADRVSMPAVDLVVKGVIGNPAYGEDSSLYESFGYVRKSERKTGLTRKKKATPTTEK